MSHGLGREFREMTALAVRRPASRDSVRHVPLRRAGIKVIRANAGGIIAVVAPVLPGRDRPAIKFQRDYVRAVGLACISENAVPIFVPGAVPSPAPA